MYFSSLHHCTYAYVQYIGPEGKTPSSDEEVHLSIVVNDVDDDNTEQHSEVFEEDDNELSDVESLTVPDTYRTAFTDGKKLTLV